jgi:hypothetical protein
LVGGRRGGLLGHGTALAALFTTGAAGFFVFGLAGGGGVGGGDGLGATAIGSGAHCGRGLFGDTLAFSLAARFATFTAFFALTLLLAQARLLFLPASFLLRAAGATLFLLTVFLFA